MAETRGGRKLSSFLLLVCPLLFGQLTIECLQEATIQEVGPEQQQQQQQQPVRITIQPQDLVAIEGESTELNCDAEGEPKPQIKWFHNGRPIESFTESRTTMAGSIQFLDIRPSAAAGGGQEASDAGVYHCLAKNQFGEARSRNASLQVACK